MNWNLLERARAGVNACSDFARECEQRQLRLIDLVRLCALLARGESTREFALSVVIGAGLYVILCG